MACSQDNFEKVWEAFDKSAKTTETLRVNRAALDDMIVCHHDTLKYSATPEQTLNSLLARGAVRQNATTYEVRRDRLCLFLMDHYACDVEEDKRPAPPHSRRARHV